jgi:hypothetical protein
MRSRFLAGLGLLAVWLGLLAGETQAGLLTAGDLTINVGQNGTLNVTWSSTQTLNYLNTQFVLRAVTGSTGGAVFTETTPGVPPMPGIPPMPPITASNYLFSGNSSAVTAGGNPASVNTDVWASDSYFFIDATDNNLDYLQDGSRLWTTLDITGVTAGTYQLRLLSSEYDYAATGGNAIALTDSDLTGGLITVNGSSPPAAVPEPTAFLLGISALAFAGRKARRSRSSASRARRHQPVRGRLG